MPDHTHAIIVIADIPNEGAPPDDSDTNKPCRDGSRTAQPHIAPTAHSVNRKTPKTSPSSTQRKPLGRLIGAFETVTTGRVNDLEGTPGAQLWQRNYHERVIRNHLAMNALRRYVANNPVLWAPRR
jgi:putative transposase